MPGRTLSDKIYDRHLVEEGQHGGADLLYVDLHLIHEVTTPQAFAGLTLAGRPVRRPDLTLATMDHSVSTSVVGAPPGDDLAQIQLELLERNCAEHGIRLLGMLSAQRGIVHMIGPELGLSQPGMVIVCGDSHTSTHGALGALAFGIGTSEVEHVLATQTLPQRRPGTLSVRVEGVLPFGVAAKDLILSIVAQLGVQRGIGKVIEYRGPAISALSMEGRLTVCNMSIEAGARAGLIAPDETTVRYLRGRRWAPRGELWDAAVADWADLRTDRDAVFDDEAVVDASTLTPTVTWGTTPAMSAPVTGRVPAPDDTEQPEQARRALAYMGLSGGERITDLRLDQVFLGSCTNGRIEDLREAAAVLRGRRVAPGVRAIAVPGSLLIKAQAEEEGLREVFHEAGFEWREPGCSMCIGMNDDVLGPGERCASTSNRNFEGRQGRDGRTHLVSPAMAAAAAVHGHFVDVRELSIQR